MSDDVMAELRGQAITAVRLSLEAKGLRYVVIEEVEYFNEDTFCGGWYKEILGIFPTMRKAKSCLWRRRKRCHRSQRGCTVWSVVDVTSDIGTWTLMEALFEK